jgi:hypothetical protein
VNALGTTRQPRVTLDAARPKNDPGMIKAPRTFEPRYRRRRKVDLPNPILDLLKCVLFAILLIAVMAVFQLALDWALNWAIEAIGLPACMALTAVGVGLLLRAQPNDDAGINQKTPDQTSRLSLAPFRPRLLVAHRCPYCRDSVSGEAATCVGCSVTLHRDCLAEAQGCVTLGCSEVPA